MCEVYGSNLEHVQAELHRLDLMIHLALANRTGPSAQSEFTGLILDEQEIESLLEPAPAGTPPSPPGEGEKWHNQLRQQTLSIEQQVRASQKSGVFLAFPLLARIFGLTAFETDVILICLAPELEARYHKLYGYLQDDVTKKYATFTLIRILLGLNFEEMIRARDFFLWQSPLIKYNILTFREDSHDPCASLLARPLVLAERITGFLTGSCSRDPVLAGVSSLSLPAAPPPEDTTLCPEIRDKLVRLCTGCLKGKSREKPVFYFYGPDAEGKKQMAAAVCRSLGFSLLQVNLGISSAVQKNFNNFACSVFTEALLCSAAVYLEHTDCLWEKEDAAASRLKILQERHSDMGWITFLSGEKPWPHAHWQNGFFEFAFPLLPAPGRLQYWQAALHTGYPLSEDVDLAALAAKFRLTRSRIRDAVLAAGNRSRQRNGKGPVLTNTDLYAACRSRSNQKLLAFGRKIKPCYTWKDIVLPDDYFAQLQELCTYVNYNTRVFGDWGFAAKHSLGKGLNILFSGASGTGKTMAAEVMANELQLDLYKIDLSNVVSKYIGETEKNLSRIFHEAETSNAILFFDEADALFGKRSEVKDAHDRYANIEINYLLQKMEEQEGIVILATNLSKNIDTAFLRRLQFFINFPSPQKAERLCIWQGIFPSETPLAEDVDFPFLAGNFDITGGLIKNITLRAAFMAAGEAAPVGMKHLMLAAKREFQKVGRLCLEADFKEYFNLVNES